MSRARVVVATLTLLALLVSSPAAAQDNAERVCLDVVTTVPVDLSDRLKVAAAIADGSLVVTGVVPCEGPEPPSATGAWELAFDAFDQDFGMAMLWSGDAVLDYLCDGLNEHLSLSLGGAEFGEEGPIEVEILVGSADALTSTWEVSFGHDSAYLFDAASAGAIVDALAGETTLEARLAPVGADPLTMTFDITGWEAAFELARERCGWPAPSM